MSFVKHRWVKRLALLVCFLFVLATVIVCKAAEDKVIASLGKYESCQAFYLRRISRLYGLCKI